MKFKEEQKFTQWWIWILLIVVTIYGVYNKLMHGEFDTDPASNTGPILSLIVIFGILALFGMIYLKTEIDEEEIRMNFFPFVKKRVSWKEIKSAKVVNYGFVGGWGVRLWTIYGTVYNIKGNKGLAVELTNGKKFLIGTQKADELNKMVAKVSAREHDL